MNNRRVLKDALRRFAAVEAYQKATGKVTAVDTVNFRCDVQIAGETVSTANIPYYRDLPVALNDYVDVEIVTGRPRAVVGRIRLN